MMSTISSLCRTCMTNVVKTTEEGVYSCNIFETENLAQKLMLCSNIEVQPSDKYPPHVCNTCCINILDFCDFQEMCRESLEKFNKMLEKQTKTGYDTNVVVSKNRLTITSDIESESHHEMILGDNSNDKQKDSVEDIIENKSDSDEDTDNDPVTGTEDCVIVDAISIARLGKMEELINCEHAYSQSGEAAVSRPLLGCSVKSEDKQGDTSGEITDYEDDSGLGYNNMLKIICSIDKRSLYLNPISTELTLNMLEDVTPDDEDKTEYECVSIEEDINEDIDLLEDLRVIEESISEIPVTASDASAKTVPVTLPCNTTTVTNIENIHTENTLSNKICVENDKAHLFEGSSHERDVNKTQIEKVDFANKEEPILVVLSECKDAVFENVHCEKEEDCIFEDLSDAEEGDKKRVAEDVAEEDYLFASPSEDEEIYSDPDTVLSDRKPKTAKYNFSCDLCPQTFILEQRLIAHKRRHQGLQGYPCSRENCTRSYNRLIDLRQHLRDHDGIPRHIYKCLINNCGLKYTTKNGLQLHLRKHHNRGPALPARKFVCEACGKVYQHAHALRVHQYMHVDDSLWPFKCDIGGCSKKFRSNSHYKIHKNRHYGIKPFACTYCEKSFCSYPNLNVHINFHTLEKKWTCNFCPKVFYTPANLRLHIRKKHENNPDAKNNARKCRDRRRSGEMAFLCEECGRSFKRACDLKMHKQTHMPRGPPKVRETVKNFYCSVCNKALANAINLKHHEMKHTVGKQFECGKCGVKFSYRRNLHRHQQKNLCRVSKSTIDKQPAEYDSIEEPIIDKNVHINM